MKLLQHILYINLEHREDRKQHFLGQIDKLNQVIAENQFGEPLQPERFNAIHLPFHGALGASKSHLECLKIARERKYPQVCIMEDDVLFTDPQLFLTQVKKFQDEFKTEDWDILMLGGNNKRPYVEVNDYCIRSKDIQTATCYVIQQHYYDTLIQNLEESSKNLEQHPLRRYAYSLDIYWKRLQRTGKWFLIIPLTVSQLEGFSDIEKKQVNYTIDLLSIERVSKRRLGEHFGTIQPNR
jgi:GR25 family glycosyltransferase involved in LPS biosynthesis